MKPPQKRPPVRLVEECESPSDGEWQAFWDRRRRKYGPLPAKPAVRGEPLARERLTSRKFEAVVSHAIYRPKSVLSTLLLVAAALAGFFLLATGIAALAGIVAR